MAYLPPDANQANALLSIIADPKTAQKWLTDLVNQEASAKAAQAETNAAVEALRAKQTDQAAFDAEVAEAKAELEADRDDVRKATEDAAITLANAKTKEAEVSARLRNLDIVVGEKERAVSLRETSVGIREKDASAREDRVSAREAQAEALATEYNQKLDNLRKMAQ